MKVYEINAIHNVSDVSELEAVLNRRHGDGYNSFWLYCCGEEYPKLSLLVKGNLATLNFFPKENDAGYVSIGKIDDLPGETTTFHISQYPADDVSAMNDAVVPFSIGLQAAKDFFASGQLPQSLEWEKL